MRLTSVLRSDASSIVVYGIGNHQFPNTKHSLGQVFVETLATRAAIAAGQGHANFTWDKTLHAWTCTLIVPFKTPQDGVSSSRMTFMKSKYPMNLSGQSLQQLLKRSTEREALTSNLIFVAHDELSLASCAYKFQLGGSAKGHNGLRDIQAKLKTSTFHHLRLGIGRPDGDSDNNRKSKMSIADWCLSPSTRQEAEFYSDLRGKVAEAAWEYIEQQRIDSLLSGDNKKDSSRSSSPSR